MNATTRQALSKVPEVTLVFWVIKIAATTLGETGGDAVSMSMNLGYLIGTAIFARDLPGRGIRADQGQNLPAAAVLDDDHRHHHGRHDAGRLRRPLAGYRICRRLGAAARLAAGLPVRLASHAGLGIGRHRQFAESRDVLLVDDHVLADAGHRARRLDRRQRRVGLRRRGGRVRRPAGRGRRGILLDAMSRGPCCSGRRSS